jgi:phage baseplate assembly protein W
MAYNPIKIFPSDTRPSTALGVSVPFNSNDVFVSTYNTVDAIKNNLINFLLTNESERFLNPSFGGNLRAFIFEQITNNNLDFLKENIQSQIARRFSNVKINELNILQNPDNNQIFIELNYSINNTGLQNNLLITF